MTTKPTVTIPALPISNFAAVANMVRKCGGDPIVTTDPQKLLSAERIILAGVGAFDAGMQVLRQGGWIEPLQHLADVGKCPILGICLGMQLMCRHSEEGALAGLGWFAADVKRIVPKSDLQLKVPHMGWNTISVERPNVLLPESTQERRFYFVHSYHVVCDDPQEVLAITNYGQDLTAVIGRNRLYGAQFHPEKSHRFGMAIMTQYLNL